MRAIGIDAARAPCVAVIEDHIVVGNTWARSMTGAIAGNVRVVAGSLVARGRLALVSITKIDTFGRSFDWLILA